MKITLELPDTTALAFINIAHVNKNNIMMLSSVSIDSDDLRNGHVNVKERISDND